MKKHSIALAGLIASGLTFAQINDLAVSNNAPIRTQADSISVTATRIPTRNNALVSDLQIFEREQIERAIGKSVPEFLQQEANIQIASNGGPGQISAIFTRGTESNHTLVLIDGVRYGSISDGAPAWAALPLANIDRIEVLKGPASTLYGSDAIGGVVQIFTKRDVDGFHPSISLSAGSRRVTEVIASVNGGNEQVHYSLGFSDLYDAAFSAANPKISSFQPDRDSFSQRSYNAALDWKLGENWKLGAAIFKSQGLNHFDDGGNNGNFPDSVVDIEANLSKAFLQGQVLPGWKTELSYGQTKNDAKTLVARFGSSSFNTTQNVLNWQNQIAVPYTGTVLLGAEQLQQKLDSSTAFDVNQRRVRSVYAGINGNHAIHSWQFNWRNDRNPQYDSANTGFIGYGLRLLPSLRLRASYGNSFSAPTFNDLYFPGFSNPNLRPERGRSAELGAEWTWGLQNVTLTVFENKIRDLVVFSAGRPRNLNKTRIFGWNLGYSGQIGPITLRANYEHLNPVDEATGKQLQRRAKEQLAVQVDYALNAWRFGASAVHTGSRPDLFFDASFNSVPVILKAYTLLNLNAAYQLTPNWSAEVKVDNASKQNYENVYGYNQPDRSFYLTTKYQF